MLRELWSIGFYEGFPTYLNKQILIVKDLLKQSESLIGKFSDSIVTTDYWQKRKQVVDSLNKDISDIESVIFKLDWTTDTYTVNRLDCIFKDTYIWLSNAIREIILIKEAVKETMIREWQTSLTDVFKETSIRKDYALLVQALIPEQLSNARNESVIHTRLITPKHKQLYDDRKFGLVYRLCADDLLSMYTANCTAIETQLQRSCISIFQSDSIVTACIGIDADYMLFSEFESKAAGHSDIILKSSARPVGIYLVSNALSEKEETFIKLYAGINRLPIYCLGKG